MANARPRSGERRADFVGALREARALAPRAELAASFLAARARSAASRVNLLRLLALGLLIYGAVGLAATLYGHALVRQAFAGARELGVMAPGEKSRALRGLESIATTLDDASASAGNMSGSFGQSQASLATASEVATELAAALREAARYTQFDILGVQPIAGMAQPFLESSDQLEVLSGDLGRTSAALSSNAADMQRLSADFQRLKVEVDGLRQSVARLPTDPTSGSGAQRLETALTAMLAWIGLQALASLFAGLAILLIPLARARRGG
jgi:hypothetical protein